VSKTQHVGKNGGKNIMGVEGKLIRSKLGRLPFFVIWPAYSLVLPTKPLKKGILKGKAWPEFQNCWCNKIDET